MAVVEYGAGVAAFWGSIGGVTFSRGGSFNIAKRRAYPRNRLILERQFNRGIFSLLIHEWKNNLTNNDRDDWADAATNFSQSRHGIAYTISGMNLFIGCNTLQVLFDNTILSAPTIFGGRLAQRTVTYAWDAVTHKVEINFAPVLGVNEKLFIWNTNADRKFATYRKIAYRNSSIMNSATGKPYDIDAEYRSQDGTIHFHFIVYDVRGAMSSAWQTYYQYTWA